MFRRWKRSTGVRLGGLGLVVVVGLLALPAIASAKAAPVSVEIGPFTAAHGYKFDLVTSVCGGTNKTTEISYFKGSESDDVDYSYAGSATCTAAKTLGKGTLSISWPGIATAKLRVVEAGKSKRGVVPQGCRGSGGTSRAVVLAGSLDISASKYFGTRKSKRVTGYISRLGNLSCGSESLPKSTNLITSFGTDLFVDASRYKNSSEVFVGDTFSPANGVTGTFFVNLLGGSKLFSISKGMATITDVKPFASGKLLAVEQPACLGDTSKAVNAIVSGTLAIDSPVLGKISLGSSTATSAYVGPSDLTAFPSNCDGIGAMPLTPAVSNDCSDPTVPCSISDGSAADMFFDASTLGTQSIVSETIDFGDGTTGTFTNGSAAHTYAAPGTYTATITIETSNGQMQTVTTPVYISA